MTEDKCDTEDKIKELEDMINIIKTEFKEAHDKEVDDANKADLSNTGGGF